MEKSAAVLKYSQHGLQTSIKKAKFVPLVATVCLTVAGAFSFCSISATTLHRIYLLEKQQLSSMFVLPEEKYCRKHYCITTLDPCCAFSWGFLQIVTGH